MQVKVTGFRPEEEEEIREALPQLAGAEFDFGGEAESAAVFVMAEAEAERLGDLLEREPEALVFLLAGKRKGPDGKERYRFVRVTSPERRAELIAEEALRAAQELKELSVRVRHDVRSPIQSIFEGVEELAALLPPDAGKECVEVMGIVQQNARRIYRAIPDFGEFHRKLEELAALLAGGTEEER
ncbi:MAG: hypothetical protein DRP90_02295 [Planctomycetota bacterium]|nr:MAG: hypothetical protein DRP90_02295 [Planctomycetota bacterium]